MSRSTSTPSEGRSRKCGLRLSLNKECSLATTAWPILQPKKTGASSPTRTEETVQHLKTSPGVELTLLMKKAIAIFHSSAGSCSTAPPRTSIPRCTTSRLRSNVRASRMRVLEQTSTLSTGTTPQFLLCLRAQSTMSLSIPSTRKRKIPCNGRKP